MYNVQGIHISSNTTLRLSDDAELDQNAFGGKANFVMASIRSKDSMIENVHIIIDDEWNPE